MSQHRIEQTNDVDLPLRQHGSFANPLMNLRSIAIGPTLIVACLVVVTGIFWPTFRDLLGVGTAATGYTHRIFVIPIFAVTVWSLRFDLAVLPIHAYWPGIVAIIVAGVLWLFGELTFIRIFTEIAVITMIPLAVLTVLGIRWLWATSFPLFFLIFAIPVRGPLVDLQVSMTAKFTHIGLLASGFPVHREGNYFEVPSGKWSIADACSGIEYLSACMMFTFLFAWTMYNSVQKRAIFIVGGIFVGITGNWLRAYLTIIIAHVSDNRLLRQDHGTFGWLLFATLLFVYCWVGWYFRDERSRMKSDGIPKMKNGSSARSRNEGDRIHRLVGTMIVTFVALAAWPEISNLFLHGKPSRPVEIADIAPRAGWSVVEMPLTDWSPALVKPTRDRLQVFEKNGRQVGVFIGVFANQSWDSKLVTSVNQFVAPESSRWNIVERGVQKTTYLGKPLQINTAIILGRGQIMARQWYWINGVATGKDIEAKIEQLRARLAGRDDVSAWVSIGGLVDSSSVTTQGTLDDFLRDMSLSIENSLVTTTAQSSS